MQCDASWRWRRQRRRCKPTQLRKVGSSRGAAPLFEVERAATPILGLRQYGVHINGMVQDRSKISLWLQVRSKTKPTFPGKLGR